MYNLKNAVHKNISAQLIIITDFSNSNKAHLEKKKHSLHLHYTYRTSAAISAQQESAIESSGAEITAQVLNCFVDNRGRAR